MRKEIKNVILPIFTLIIGYSASAFSASPPPPPHHHPHEGPEGDRGPGHDGPRPHEIIELTNYSGKVSSFIANDDKVYDAFNINISGKDNLIKFPPHMGKEIMRLIKNGDNVTISGANHKNPEGKYEIGLESITKDQTTILNKRPPRKDPDSEKVINTEGTIEKLKLNKEGKVTGIYLKDNIIVRLPKQVIDKLGNQVAKGEKVKISGNEKNESGFAFSEKVTILDARIIDIKGKSYLIR